jgi:hypothetical protein
MNGTKSPLSSIGIMGPLASLIVLVLNRLFPGLGLDEATVAAVIDTTAVLFGLLSAIYGRWRARSRIAVLPVVAALLLVSACGALTGGTPAADVFAMRAGYNAAFLAPAVAYNALPRCAEAVPQPCSQQSVVSQLRKADAAAKAALDAAETVVRDAPGVDARTAINAAREAIGAAVAIVAIYGGK